ncbi:MAG: hypothetical protein ACJAW1_003048 [Glaciecola sp.]
MKVLSSFDWNGIDDCVSFDEKKAVKRAKISPFHMTHMDNIKGIAKHGLLSHNLAHTKHDISNRDVNARRSRPDPIHNRPIHSYVPFYMNPRNAFMYANREHLDDCVLIKMDKEIIYHPGAIYTVGNAARNDAKFYNDLEDINQLPDSINARSWYSCQVTKSEMMSEILVPKQVPTKFFNTMIFRKQKTLNKVYKSIKKVSFDRFDGINMICDKEMFF